MATIEYGLRGRKTRLLDPDMGTWNYIVDALGLVRTQTDGKSQVATHTYDLLNG